MIVDLSSQVAGFKEFFTSVYKERVEETLLSYPRVRSIYVAYADLEKFDPDLADALIINPDMILEAAEEGIRNLGLSNADEQKFVPHIRFFNLPEKVQITSKEVNARLKGQLISVKAFVTSLPLPFIATRVALYRCQVCNEEIKLLVSANFKQPKQCDCCKKFALKEIDEKSIHYDVQEGESCFVQFRLEDDLVGKVYQDSYVILNGIVRLKEDKTRKTLRLFLDVNSISVIEERVKLLDDLPKDVQDDIAAFDAYPKAPLRLRTPIPQDIRKQVLEKGNFKCASCGVSWESSPLEIDHIIPVASGAEDVNNVTNLQVLCRRCNNVKRASLPFAFKGRKQFPQEASESKELSRSFDVDVVTTGNQKSTREYEAKSNLILRVIKKLLKKGGNARLASIIEIASKLGLDEADTKKILNDFLKRGIIYERQFDDYRIVGRA